MKQWQALSQRYAELTVRERVLVLATGAFLIAFLLYFLWLDTIWQQGAKTEKEIAKVEQNNQQLSLQLKELKSALKRDPNEGIRKELTEFKQQITGLDQQLGELTLDLVSPSQMLPVLQNLLQQTSEVQLLALNSKPPEAVLQNPERPDLGMFKHTIELHLRGSYFQVHELLQAIEQSQWRFYWSKMNYQVTSYPNAEVRLELYTLSTSEDYIRV